MLKKGIILFFISLLVLPGKAQKTQSLFDNYTSTNGLPAFNITKILQDQYGFMWLTSQQGIHCFDGKTYFTITYDYQTPELFRQSHIRDMYLDGDSLWVAISYGGVSIIDVKRRKVVNSLGCSSDKYAPCNFSNWILSIEESKNHEMWLGGYEGLFVVSKNTQLIQVIDVNPFSGRKEDFASRCLAVDQKNRIWVGIDDWGIAVYDGKTKKLIQTIEDKNWLPDNKEHLIIRKILADPEKGILISTNAGVFVIRDDNSFRAHELKFNAGPSQSKLISKNFNSITKLPGNRYWFSTYKGCFSTDENFTVEEIYSTANSNLADDIVFSHYIDRDGLLWIACYKGISLMNQNKKAFTNYRFANKEMQDKGQFLSSFAMNDSMLITATLHGMFILNMNNGSLKKIPGADDNEIEFFAIEKLPDGHIFTSSGAHLYIIENKKDLFRLIPAEKKYSELTPIAQEAIISALTVNDSIVAMGSQSESGIFLWNLNQKKITVYKRVTGNHTTPVDNNVNHISKDRDGNIWIASDMALMKFEWQKGKFTNYFHGNKEIPFNSTILYDLYDDGSYYWIATYSGGISRVNKKTHAATTITTNEGLCNNCVFSLTPVNGYLWATTDRGISRINIQTLQIKNYYIENGLHDNSFDDRSVSHSGPFLFFSGLTGLTRVDTRLLKSNLEKPTTYITDISFNSGELFKNVSGINQKRIELPPHTSTIAIRLSAISFPEGYHTKFLYRIPEINNSWILHGENNQVTLAGLTHGKYRFQAKSLSAEGVESEKITEMEIVILPAWYQTLWFKLLVILGSVLLLFYFIRLFYLYNLRKKQAVMEKQLALQYERQRISSDLHDDIGSTLSSINIYAGLANKETNNKLYLESIKQNVNEVVGKLDDLVWSINPRNDTLGNIAERLDGYAGPASKMKEIVFTLSIDEEVKSLKPAAEIKHHLYMTAKELINNAIKHSGCRHIRLSMEKQHNNIFVTVSDDGKGFDTKVIKKDRNGLNNITQRANALNAALEIQSSPGRGTTATLKVPI